MANHISLRVMCSGDRSCIISMWCVYLKHKHERIDVFVLSVFVSLKENADKKLRKNRVCVFVRIWFGYQFRMVWVYLFMFPPIETRMRLRPMWQKEGLVSKPINLTQVLRPCITHIHSLLLFWILITPAYEESFEPPLLFAHVVFVKLFDVIVQTF